MTRGAERLYVRLDEDTTHGPESGTPAGSLRAVAVAPALRPQLATLMCCRETIAPGTLVQERVLPDGAVRLVFNVGDTPSSNGRSAPALAAIGASAAPALVQLRGTVHGFSAVLRPGAAAALLGLPAGELAQTVVPLDALWGAAARRLQERLAEAPDDIRRAALLQTMLLERLQRARPAAPAAAAAAHAWRLIHATAGRRPLSEVAAAVGLGERRLQQLFRTEIGLTPRTTSRLARLQGLLRRLREPRRPAWAELALDAGFADQSHLANEFRALAGLTPTQFLDGAVSGSSKTGR